MTAPRCQASRLFADCSNPADYMVGAVGDCGHKVFEALVCASCYDRGPDPEAGPCDYCGELVHEVWTEPVPIAELSTAEGGA